MHSNPFQTKQWPSGSVGGSCNSVGGSCNSICGSCISLGGSVRCRISCRVHSIFLGLLTLQFMFGAHNHGDTILTTLQQWLTLLSSSVSSFLTYYIWIRSFTSGNILEFGALFAAPALWLSLLFLSFCGLSNLSSVATLDPRFGPANPFVPDLHPTRRLKEQARRQTLRRQHRKQIQYTSQLFRLHLAQWYAAQRQRQPPNHGLYF